MVTQRADFIIDDRPYTLARTGGDIGSRAWQEQGPQAAEISQPMRDVARGELGKEVRIHWSTKHRGFGEPLRTIEGRDYWGRNIDKRYPYQVTLARLQTSVNVSAWTPAAGPSGMVDFDSKMYLAYGRYVISIDPASSDATAEKYDAGADVAVEGIAAFQSTVFAALGESNTFRHTTDGTTWTAHTGSLTATHFLPVQDRLYRISKGSSGTTPTHLSNNSVDPTDNLNWSALDTIGDPGIPATGLASVAYQLFVAKEDGLYAADIETGRFPSLTPELAAWRDTVNGNGVFGWGGLTFMPTVRGLKMYYAGQLFSAGPEVMSANDSEVVGYITAMSGDANWLFAALYNGTDTYVLAGRNPKPDDRYPGEFTWNVVWYMSGGPYTAMTISGLNNDPRLWLAREGDVRYIKLGDTLDNPLQDSTATYMATGTDYYPAHDGGSPMVDKHFLELRVSAEQLSYSCYITWSYKLDDETNWTTLGITKSSPTTVLKFDTATDVIGRRIELKAVYTRGATTTDTPILRNIDLLAVEFPPNRKLLSASFLVADKTLTRTGVDARSAAQVVEDLEALVAARKQVTLTDPLGRSSNALPLGPVLVREVLSQDSKEPVVIAMAQYLIMED